MQLHTLNKAMLSLQLKNNAVVTFVECNLFPVITGIMEVTMES